MTQATLQPIDKILERLDKVKQKGGDKWLAPCPAHDDKSPSLAITECSDGTVLLKCWCGCTASDIVAAIGLELRDLFPYDPTNKVKKHQPSQRAIAHERLIVSLAETAIKQGKTLSETDNNRYQLAMKRIKGVSHD